MKRHDQRGPASTPLRAAASCVRCRLGDHDQCLDVIRGRAFAAIGRTLDVQLCGCDDADHSQHE